MTTKDGVSMVPLVVIGAFVLLALGATVWLNQRPDVRERIEDQIGINNGAEVSPTPTPTPEPEFGWDRTGNYVDRKIVYEEPGRPALNMRLIFDNQSLCDGEVCVPASIGRGQRIRVEGEEKPEGVLVRRLTRLEETGGGEITKGGEVVTVDWRLAEGYIRDCKIEKVFQDHQKNVTLYHKDGRRLETVEPKIDDIFSVVRANEAKCGQVDMMTE